MAKTRLTASKQRVAADILTQFMFTRDMEDVLKVWDSVFSQYELCDDPFTHTPCTSDEYAKNCLEYEKQIMFERYGHCDGFE